MSKIKILSGQEAINLWLQGKNAWNTWVDKNPEADVDFTGLDFRDYDDISFNSFKFPKGNVNFYRVDFGFGGLDFSGADFGVGNVSFKLAQIRNCDVSFAFAKFGDGDIDFSEINFSDKDLLFTGAVFGKGKIYFSNCVFGKADVFFKNVNFGDGQVYFCDTKFGEGIVDFSNANFSNGLVTFENSVLTRCNSCFSKVNFSNGGVIFRGAKFYGGNVDFSLSVFHGFREDAIDFSGAEFTKVNVSFDYSKFKNLNVLFDGVIVSEGFISFNSAEFMTHEVSFNGASFDDAKFTDIYAKATDEFSLQHSIFNKSLDLSGSIFGCIIDLRHIHVKGKTDIDGVKCSLKRQRPWKSLSLVTKITDVENIPRLRVLKEIAESNKDHDRALYFHAEEMRAKRWVRRGKRASILDGLFSLFSNYGQSIFKPFLFLILSTVIFQFVYLCLSSAKCEVWKLLMFSIANSTPFIAISKSMRAGGLKLLFPAPDGIPYWIYGVMGLQNALALVFMFLVVLGLRNRFRI